MKTLNIALFGGTGFVGHHLCALMASLGHKVTVFSRRPDKSKDLMVLPTVTTQALDVYDLNAVLSQTKGFDVAINLIGILNEKGHQGEGFRKAHVDSTRNIIQACQRNHIPRLIHLSALNADAKKGSSYYLLSKGVAENLVLSAQSPDCQVTCFRPSVLFGPGDSFLTKFAQLCQFSPGVMLLPSSQAILSPLYVGDLTQVIAQSLTDPQTFGQSYDLCGPRAYTLKELVQYTAQVTGKRRWIVGLNQQASKIVAHIFEYLPLKPYSVDNYLSALTPSVCTHPFPPVFNLSLTALESIAPGYLGPHHLNDPYRSLRQFYSKSQS